MRAFLDPVFSLSERRWGQRAESVLWLICAVLCLVVVMWAK